MNNCKEIKHYIKNNELDLEKIINEYSSYTATVINNMAKDNLNKEDKEEIISEVFFILWKNKNKLNINKYMDYKKSKAPVNTVTRNIMDLCDQTGNIYESVAIISKRANQIAVEIKQDLNKKLAEFASYNDSLEEVFENREQIEISRYYEKLPKPTLLATQEFIEGNVYFRDPSQDNNQEQA